MNTARHFTRTVVLLASAYCLFSLSASAQKISNDAYNEALLSKSPFVYDKLVSPFPPDWFFSIDAGNVRFGLNPYQGLLSRQPNIPALDTNKGVSMLNVLLGSKREQLLYLDHVQHLGRNVIGWINYNSIVSPGFLLNSFSRYQRIESGFVFGDSIDKFMSHFEFRYQNLSADENGGVEDSVESVGLSFSDYEQLPTRLNDDSRRVRTLSLKSKTDFALFSNIDSSLVSGLDLSVNIGLERFGTSYRGSSDSLYYPDEFISKDATFDTSSFLHLYAAPDLSYSWKRQQSSFMLGLSSRVNQLEIRNDTIREEVQYLSHELVCSLSKAQWEFDFKSVVVNSNWLNNGDKSARATFVWRNDSGLVSRLEFVAYGAELMPEYTKLNYRSNHFVWNNTFLPEGLIQGSVALSMLSNSLTLAVHHQSIRNWIYTDETARPAQLGNSASNFAADALVKLERQHWRFRLELRHNQVDDARLRLPEWSARLRVSRAGVLFKGALKAECGVSAYGTSAYKALGYMPATGLFFLQDDQAAGGEPVLDLFFHAGMGRATLTLLVQRVNDGWWGGENRLAAYYPVPPRTLKFGLRWLLYN
ncbi:MAG: putative porin [Bacteroidota bacterium]